MTVLRQERLDGPSGEALLAAFMAEIVPLYPGWTPDTGPSATADELSPPTGLFLVAYVDDEPVGCGGIKRLSDEAAELKRLYVAQDNHAAFDTAAQLGYYFVLSLFPLLFFLTALLAFLPLGGAQASMSWDAKPTATDACRLLLPPWLVRGTGFRAHGRTGGLQVHTLDSVHWGGTRWR